jgi:hypothetical protein
LNTKKVASRILLQFLLEEDPEVTTPPGYKRTHSVAKRSKLSSLTFFSNDQIEQNKTKQSKAKHSPIIIIYSHNDNILMPW